MTRCLTQRNIVLVDVVAVVVAVILIANRQENVPAGQASFQPYRLAAKSLRRTAPSLGSFRQPFIQLRPLTLWKRASWA